MIAEGSTAPSFELTATKGNVTSLASITAKGPVLLAFFKISCPTCQFTFPFLERLSKSATLQVFGISQDDAEGTEEFNQAFGVHFPTLLDNRDNGYTASKAFGIENVPSLVVVETDGSVSAADAGFTKPLLEELGERAGVEIFHADEKIPIYRPG